MRKLVVGFLNIAYLLILLCARLPWEPLCVFSPRVVLVVPVLQPSVAVPAFHPVSLSQIVESSFRYFIYTSTQFFPWPAHGCCGFKRFQSCYLRPHMWIDWIKARIFYFHMWMHCKWNLGSSWRCRCGPSKIRFVRNIVASNGRNMWRDVTLRIFSTASQGGCSTDGLIT